MHTTKEFNEFNSYIDKRKYVLDNEIKSTSQIQFDQILDEKLFQTPEYRKKQIEQIFSELLKLQREIKLVIYKMTSENERHEFKKISLEMERSKVLKSCHIDQTERDLHIKQINDDIMNDEKESRNIIANFEMKLKKCKIRVKCCLRDMANLKDTFKKEHNLIIDKMLNFKIKASPTTGDIVQKKIEFFNECFKNELNKINQYEQNLTNQTYNTDDISSDLDGSTSNSSCKCKTTSKSSSSLSFTNAPERDCDIKAKETDKDQEYIKQNLAKPLVQALSAITLYQPTDPIYFLANYLLHCRHNELMHAKKDLKFEMLMNERKELEKPKPKCVCVDCDNLVTGNDAIV